MGDARGLLRIVHCIGGWPVGLEVGGGLKMTDPNRNEDENGKERKERARRRGQRTKQKLTQVTVRLAAKVVSRQDVEK